MALLYIMANHYYSEHQDVASNPSSYDFNFRNHSFKFTTDAGVFSKHYIDFGSFTMLEAFTPNDIKAPILDMGCGYGRTLEELYNYENTTAKVTTQNGVLGILITSLKNGNTLFLPATRKRIDVDLEDVDYLGNYWTRSLIPEDILIPETKFLRTYPTKWGYEENQPDGRTILVLSTCSRIYGLAVRPVRAKK